MMTAIESRPKIVTVGRGVSLEHCRLDGGALASIELGSIPRGDRFLEPGRPNLGCGVEKAVCGSRKVGWHRLFGGEPA